MTRFHPLRIAALAQETRDAVLLTLEVPEEKADLFHFRPGQFLTLRRRTGEGEIRRSYSICSAPHERELRIAIKRVQGGAFSTWAHRDLQAGAMVEVAEPSGTFCIPSLPDASRHHVAFAAGSGITPVLSILKSVLHQEPQSRFTLVYGNRASSSVLFKEELAGLKDRFLDRLNLVFILSREQQDIDLFNGRIDRDKCDKLLTRWIDPSDIDVAYLCGPLSMMDSARESLISHGIDRARIQQEAFGTPASLKRERAHSAVQAADLDCRVFFLQDGRRHEFQMQRGGKTLLDAALDQGVDLPYSCKGGVCSTCRCRLASGEVEMDVHFALEDYEIARGFILPCQSYPLTGELELDYDAVG